MLSYPASIHATPRIHLLADSQLLFRSDDDRPLLKSLQRAGVSASTRAAYVGASNGDVPEYYEIFEAAMGAFGVADRRHIASSFSLEDAAYLRTAGIIVLAGGDVRTGWEMMTDTGMDEIVKDRYRAGASLIGVSAGAVQLGRYGLITRGDQSTELFRTYNLCPFVIAAHDEQNDWEQLTTVIGLLDDDSIGLGIRSGGGAMYHPDGRLEAIRYPVVQLTKSDVGVSRGWILP